MFRGEGDFNIHPRAARSSMAHRQSLAPRKATALNPSSSQAHASSSQVSKAVGYPILKAWDIVDVFQSLGIALTEEDVNKPTPFAIQHAWRQLLAETSGVTMEGFERPKGALLGMMQYPVSPPSRSDQQRSTRAQSSYAASSLVDAPCSHAVSERATFVQGAVTDELKRAALWMELLGGRHGRSRTQTSSRGQTNVVPTARLWPAARRPEPHATFSEPVRPGVWAAWLRSSSMARRSRRPRASARLPTVDRIRAQRQEPASSPVPVHPAPY